LIFNTVSKESITVYIHTGQRYLDMDTSCCPIFFGVGGKNPKAISENGTQKGVYTTVHWLGEIGGWPSGLKDMWMRLTLGEENSMKV
jgi:hypothetical protein